MGESVLLTDRRKDLLEGEYDKDDPSDRMVLSRFQRSTETAVDELIQIAENPHVDHSEMIQREQVVKLLRAILTPPPEHVNSGGLIRIKHEDEPPKDPPQAELSEEFQQYQDGILADISQLIIEERYNDNLG